MSANALALPDYREGRVYPSVAAGNVYIGRADDNEDVLGRTAWVAATKGGIGNQESVALCALRLRRSPVSGQDYRTLTGLGMATLLEVSKGWRRHSELVVVPSIVLPSAPGGSERRREADTGASLLHALLQPLPKDVRFSPGSGIEPNKSDDPLSEMRPINDGTSRLMSFQPGVVREVQRDGGRRCLASLTVGKVLAAMEEDRPWLAESA